MFSEFFPDFTWAAPAPCLFAVPWTLCSTSPWPLLVFTFSSPFIACFHLKILLLHLFLNCCLCCANTQPLAVSFPCTISYWFVHRLPSCSQFLDCFPLNGFFFYSENLVAADSSEIVNICIRLRAEVFYTRWRAKLKKHKMRSILTIILF